MLKTKIKVREISYKLNLLSGHHNQLDYVINHNHIELKE